MNTDTRKKTKDPTSRAKAASAEASTSRPVTATVRRAGQSGRRPTKSHAKRIRVRSLMTTAVVVVGAIAVLALVFVLSNQQGSSSNGQGGKYPYQVGQPGPGEQAPAVKLPSTDGSTFDLSSLRGQTVLLYFQEGVGCQPCWDQMKDIQAKRGEFQGLAIDQIVTITGDPLGALKEKVANEKITLPVLSDSGLAVSRTYHANQYGMMGAGADGHTFILVGKDGAIKWRADYGGPPKYTMYVPVPDLMADLRNGIAGGSR